MKKYKCLVIEDEPLGRELICDYINDIDALQLVAVCKNAMEAYEILTSIEIDLMFLDLHLPKIKGLDFLESLKQHPKVIITTAYPEYAVKSYEYDVVDYVLKPIEFSRFLTAVNKFVSNDKQNNTIQDFLFFNVNKKQVKVYYEDIDYIESQKEYVKIVTVNQTIITKYSISQLEKELPLNKFIRTHRSFIVNIKKILSFSHNEIVLNNQHIPIGRLYKDSTIAQLNTI